MTVKPTFETRFPGDVEISYLPHFTGRVFKTRMFNYSREMLTTQIIGRTASRGFKTKRDTIIIPNGYTEVR